MRRFQRLVRRMVRVLLQGIVDPHLDSAQNQVLMIASLKVTFNSAINFINKFLDEKKLFGSSVNEGIKVVMSLQYWTCYSRW
jgi:hypothetical protein